jgi:dephospho-CoA kinase
VIRESALANSFQQENCHWLIEVDADEVTRQRRVFQRSKLSKEAFDQRNALQLRNSNFPTDFIFKISNNDSDFVLPEVLKIHAQLMA